MKKNPTPLADHEIDRAGASVCSILDASLDRMNDTVAARLSAARHRAIAARQAVKATTTAVATGDGTAALTGWGADLRRRVSDWRFWAVGLAVSVLLATYGTRLWQEQVTPPDVLDVDILILGDDVPVDALLDRGFSHFVQEGE